MKENLDLLIESCLRKKSEKCATIIRSYYSMNSTTHINSTNLALMYGDSRQYANKAPKDFRDLIIELLKGDRESYKGIEANVDSIEWYTKVKSDFVKRFYSKSELEEILGFEIKDNINTNLLLDVIGIYPKCVEADFNIYVYGKLNINIALQTAEAILALLNEVIFWFKTQELYLKTVKKNKISITLNDFLDLLKCIIPIEYNDNSECRLIYSRLSSLEKKGLRVLEDAIEPIHKSEIIQKMSQLEGRIIKEESVINVFSTNEAVMAMGKTGKWVLSKYDYDTRNQVDIILWAFTHENLDCEAISSKRIYSAICNIREDITLQKILAYLHSRKDLFLPIGNDKFVLRKWSKKYKKEINAYERDRLNRNRLDLVIRSLFVNKNEYTSKEIRDAVLAEGINLSESRLNVLLKNDYLNITKKGNKNIYSLSISREDNSNEFINKILMCLREVKNGVENRKAYEALYNYEDPKVESMIQIILYEQLRGYLKADDIDLSRETITGTGPVDFKFSKGFTLRTFMELKLGSSEKLFDGLTTQLRQYMGAERVSLGIFLVVIFSDDEYTKINDIKEELNRIQGEYGMKLHFEYIDARKNLHRASPSKLKKGEEHIVEFNIQ